MEKAKRKQTIIHMVICVGLVCLIWGGYIFGVTQVRRIREEETIKKLSVEQDNKILEEVENVKSEDGKLVLSGWVIREESRNLSIHVLLRGKVGVDAVVVSTNCEERGEVGNFFLPDWDFGENGFVASVRESELDKDTSYEILVALSYEDWQGMKGRKKISTGQYLYNGELYRYNPETFMCPDITDSELLQVIEKGSLLEYNEEHKLWVYQYDWHLYYILDSKFGSMRDAKIGIPIMPRTSRVELLPENRKQYGSDHLGFFFEDIIYQREGIGRYQIVVVPLPEEYPITYISTGLYNNIDKKWIYICNIEVLHDCFEK